jgi:hypothetical protein
MLAGLEALKKEAGYFSETLPNGAKSKDKNVIILFWFTSLRYVVKTSSNACYLKKYTEHLLGSLHFPLVLFFCNFI